MLSLTGFLVLARKILVDKLFFLLAVKGNKGATAPRTVNSIGSGEGGVLAIKVAKFHGLLPD